jgi:hypothetical protein
MGLSSQLLPAAALSGAENRFGEDVSFLSRHVETIVLESNRSQSAGARVAVVPAYQGRVMTSTAGGAQGVSYGWINYAHIASGRTAPQINVYGGEERFWLGPEGGQFGLFFPAGSEFVFSDWQTPPLIDTEPFDVVSRNDHSVSFRKDAEVKNYANTKFRMRIERTVELLTLEETETSLKVKFAAIPFVGYRTINRVTNTGDDAWTKARGLPSIWLLGMYKHSPATTVFVPFRQGSEAVLGPVVNDDYFGDVPVDYLRIDDNTIFFSGNGRRRGKIGLSPRRSLGICGSFDPDRGVLTVVKYERPPADVTDYVNSMWEVQEHPFAGDVVNAYNDGPPEPGEKPLGPFYELETSSPALALKPGETGEHVQETYHFEGNDQQLDALSRSIFDVSIEQIESALPDLVEN